LVSFNVQTGQIIKSPLSKIVVVIWCFVVLILVQSYTASLSSMLTAKRLRPSVKSLDQLLLTGDYVGYQNGSFVGSLLKKRGFMPSRLRSYGTQKEYAEALRKGSMNGGVSAIVDEIPYLTSFLSNPQYQKEFQMVNRFYKTPGFGFVSFSILFTLVDSEFFNFLFFLQLVYREKFLRVLGKHSDVWCLHEEIQQVIFFCLISLHHVFVFRYFL
jgi:hypothetical protein